MGSSGINDKTHTCCVKLTSQGRLIPEAAPEKLRAVAFQPGDNVEYWSESMGKKWIPAKVQSFNPQKDTYCLNLLDGRQAFDAAPEKVRAARGHVIKYSVVKTIKPIVPIVSVVKPIVACRAQRACRAHRACRASALSLNFNACRKLHRNAIELNDLRILHGDGLQTICTCPHSK